MILPPGRAKLATKPCATGSLNEATTIGMVRVACFSATTTAELLATITSGAAFTSPAAYAWMRHVAAAKTIVDPDVAPFSPSERFKSLPKRRDADLRLRIVFLGRCDENADPPHAIGLLRAEREWRSDCRARKNSNELPSPHSISSSARTSSDGGIVNPSALATLTLMTSSIVVGCSTGRSKKNSN